MTIFVELKGAKAYKERLRKFGRRTGKRLKAVIKDNSEKIRDTAIDLVNSPPASGRIYYQGTPKEHQASAPGQSPMTWTGELANSIVVIDVGKSNYQVVAMADYAIALEYGTIDMEPRPFMSVAYAIHYKDFMKQVRGITKR